MFNTGKEKNKNSSDGRGEPTGKKIIADIVLRGGKSMISNIEKMPAKPKEKTPALPKEHYLTKDKEIAVITGREGFLKRSLKRSIGASKNYLPGVLEKSGANSPLISVKPPAKSKSYLWMPMLGGFVFFAAIILLLTFIFNSLIITITPKVEEVDVVNVGVSVDSHAVSVNLINKVIPGQLLDLPQVLTSGSFKSTGKKNVEEKARGMVKIYNSFSSAPQTLVATTRFISDSGKLFRLPKTIIVPGAIVENGSIKPSFIETELVSDEAGEDFNIGPSRFSIPGFKGTPKYNGFYAESESAFVGGVKGAASVVSKDDIKNATEAVTAELFNNLRDALSAKIPDGLRLIDGLREVVIESVNAPKAGAVQENFSIEVKGRARAILFRESDLENFLGGILLAGEEGKAFVANSFSPVFSKIDFKPDKGTASFVINGKIKIKSVIDKEKLSNSVAGKKIGTIGEILKKDPAIASFSLKMFPFWNISAPYNSAKIRVIVKEPVN